MTGNALDSIEKLDIFSDTETFDNVRIKLCSSWTAKDTCGVASLGNNKILIFGGNIGYSRETFTFNCKTNEIETMRPIKKQEAFFNCCVKQYGDGKKADDCDVEGQPDSPRRNG